MIFDLSEEQKMMRKTVRDFAEREVLPRAAEIDEADEFPRDIFRKAADLGLLAVTLPEEHGGAGADAICSAIASEELGRSSAAVSHICSSVKHHLFCLYHYGTEAQKRKYLGPLARGEIIGSFALTETNAGSDAAGIAATAILDGDSYVINGNKMFITLGPLADLSIVFAFTDKSKGTKGISAFIVEKGTSGFAVGKKEKKLGQRGNPVSELIFTDCRVSRENLLGAEGQGLKIALHSLDSGRIEIAALACGLIRAALEASVSYAKKRVQFGQPVANFQLIQSMIAGMASDLEAARLLTYQAAYLNDQGRPFTREAAIAKRFATEAAMKHTTNAIQIHGGYGYCQDYPVERFFRDAKLTQIYEGTNQIQELVIAREVLKGA